MSNSIKDGRDEYGQEANYGTILLSRVHKINRTHLLCATIASSPFCISRSSCV